MQTFLPYESFGISLQELDSKRLGKQRVEAYQLLRTLIGQSRGWANHPCTKMWRGYELALAFYGILACEEWKSRKYEDNLIGPIKLIATGLTVQGAKLTYPWWLGEPRLHASHRSNLLRKDPDFYGKCGWAEPPTLEYYWPTLGDRRGRHDQQGEQAAGWQNQAEDALRRQLRAG